MRLPRTEASPICGCPESNPDLNLFPSPIFGAVFFWPVFGFVGRSYHAIVRKKAANAVSLWTTAALTFTKMAALDFKRFDFVFAVLVFSFTRTLFVAVQAVF